MSGQVEAIQNIDETAAQADPGTAVVDQEAGARMDEAVFRKAVEAALLTSQEPLTLSELKKLGDETMDNRYVEGVLAGLVDEYADSGVELTQVASGWRFRARPEIQAHLGKLNPQKPPRYSRAVMETLAIIAYRQPVTRGDIEEIRGVSVASQVLKTLESRGWIDTVGTRDVPGRPALYATTKQLLDDLNLRSLQELPSLEEVGNLLEPGALQELEEAAGHSGLDGVSVVEDSVPHVSEADAGEADATGAGDAGDAVAATPVEEQPQGQGAV